MNGLHQQDAAAGNVLPEGRRLIDRLGLNRNAYRVKDMEISPATLVRQGGRSGGQIRGADSSF